MKDELPVFKSWVLRADQDVHSLLLLLENNTDFDNVCFLAQQACEKYLKAFLAFCEQEIEFTHDLVRLARLCQKYDNNCNFDLSGLEQLKKYATEGRYSISDPADRSAAGEAWSIARLAIDLLKQKMNE